MANYFSLPQELRFVIHQTSIDGARNAAEKPSQNILTPDTRTRQQIKAAGTRAAARQHARFVHIARCFAEDGNANLLDTNKNAEVADYVMRRNIEQTIKTLGKKDDESFERELQSFFEGLSTIVVPLSSLSLRKRAITLRVLEERASMPGENPLINVTFNATIKPYAPIEMAPQLIRLGPSIIPIAALMPSATQMHKDDSDTLKNWAKLKLLDIRPLQHAADTSFFVEFIDGVEQMKGNTWPTWDEPIEFHDLAVTALDVELDPRPSNNIFSKVGNALKGWGS